MKKSVPQSKPTGLAEAIRIDPGQVQNHVNELVRGTVEEIGAFPDGQSALMLVAARLRHMASTR
jgi:hypothetical protein